MWYISHFRQSFGKDVLTHLRSGWFSDIEDFLLDFEIIHWFRQLFLLLEISFKNEKNLGSWIPLTVNYLTTLVLLGLAHEVNVFWNHPPGHLTKTGQLYKEIYFGVFAFLFDVIHWQFEILFVKRGKLTICYALYRCRPFCTRLK